MLESPHDTIFAAASGQGRAAVCVIRISGDRSRAILEAMTGSCPDPRRLALRVLKDPQSGEALDHALVAWMPGPASFTGEDQVELHIHGGLATREAVIRALGAIDGCRPAQAGEFTRRAFLNGRMDLSQVEGLADIIDAETEAQRRQAMRQLQGRLGHAVEQWRENLLQILALLEASLDFADEDDVPETFELGLLDRIGALESEIAAALHNRTGERVRDGMVVVLAGAPNAGKSTLLNYLAQRDVAIVSSVAGTTRDVIEVRCDLAGLPVTFVDTAGIRDSLDPIEREGVARARTRVAQADIVLWLMAPDDPEEPTPASEAKVIRVATKADLAPSRPADFTISATTGVGIADLLAAIEREVLISQDGSSDVVLTRQRHRDALERTSAALRRALIGLRASGPSEIVAEDVRLAMRAIGQVAGRVDVDDVLDRLFATFCIGK